MAATRLDRQLALIYEMEPDVAYKKIGRFHRFSITMSHAFTSKQKARLRKAGVHVASYDVRITRAGRPRCVYVLEARF